MLQEKLQYQAGGRCTHCEPVILDHNLLVVSKVVLLGDVTLSVPVGSGGLVRSAPICWMSRVSVTEMFVYKLVMSSEARAKCRSIEVSLSLLIRSLVLSVLCVW